AILDRGRAPTHSPLLPYTTLFRSRVLAGPTCSQILACLGADVLRIDPPEFPEIIEQYLVTGMGKRSAVADLNERGDEVRTLARRSEEHTSELQSRENLVCRLLLEK